MGSFAWMLKKTIPKIIGAQKVCQGFLERSGGLSLQLRSWLDGITEGGVIEW